MSFEDTYVAKTYEVQTTLKAYLRELPDAIGHLDYEISGNRIVIRKGGQWILITLEYEGERHLGSLDLPMTQVRLEFVGYDKQSAEEFIKHFNQHMMRVGGG